MSLNYQEYIIEITLFRYPAGLFWFSVIGPKNLMIIKDDMVCLGSMRLGCVQASESQVVKSQASQSYTIFNSSQN